MKVMKTVDKSELLKMFIKDLYTTQKGVTKRTSVAAIKYVNQDAELSNAVTNDDWDYVVDFISNDEE